MEILTFRAFTTADQHPHSGNPAGAAGLGSCLRAGGHLALPAVIQVEQGAEIGRPSSITVEIPVEGRVRVTGTAMEL